MKIVYKILSIFLLFSSVLVYGQENNSSIGGLFFDYYNEPDERPYYDVFEKPHTLPEDSLNISFDMRLHGENYNIGHLLTCYNTPDEYFNIILKKSESKEDQNKYYFNLNLKSFNSQLVVPLRTENSDSKWFNVKLSFDFVNSLITFNVDGKESQLDFDEDQTHSEHAQAKFVFGRCEHYLDILPFAIRNLHVKFDKSDNIFPLDEAFGNKVHNLDGKQIGVCHNPTWLYESHYKWEKKLELHEDEVSAVCLDEENGILVIHSSDTTFYYHLGSGFGQEKLEKRLTPNIFRFSKFGDCNYVYLPEYRKLVMYNKAYSERESEIIDKNGLEGFKQKHGEEPKVAYYDLNNGRTTITSNALLGDRFHQASVFYDKDTKTIYEFGGYASYKYYNHVKRLNRNTKKWEDVKFKGDTITPRFYTSTGTHFEDGKSYAYLYGGYGNSVGSQDFGGEYYHDFYRLDLKNRTIEKIIDFELPEFDQVPCRDLLIVPEENSFYTFCYPQYKADSELQLYRFDWKNKKVTPYGSAIPFRSTQIMTQISLFHDNPHRCLIAVIQEFLDYNKCNIKVYQLNEPALAASEWVEIEKEPDKNHSLLYMIIGILAGLLLIGGLAFWLIRKRKQAIASVQEAPAEAKPAEEEAEEIEVDEEALKEINQPQPTVLEAVKKNSIYLLGEFTVFDKTGKDISYLFSAKIRQLFLLIFMHTYRSTSQGIASKEISFIMWPEKELAESKNIRGVTIKYLRDALADVEGIEVVSQGGKWFINIDRDLCYCDFLTLLESDLSNIDNYDDMRPYVHILRRGSLLSAESYEWLDSFKAEFEEVALHKMRDKMYQAFDSSQFLISYKISQVLLRIAPLDEELMKVEINSLIKLGDPIKAKAKFRQFSVNYYEAYEENLQYEDYII